MKLSAAILLLAVAAAAPDQRYFRYERALVRPAQSSGQSCLVLDPAFFPHAAPLLTDLRLYRDAVETPYVIHIATPTKPGQKPLPPLNLGMRGGQTVFDAAMPDGRYSDVQIGVTGQNYIATVTVTGSRQQGTRGETRLGAYTIFDLTRQKLGASTVLHLPESDFRYLHFRIAGPLIPRNITGVWVMRLPPSQPRYLTVQQTAQTTEREHSTVFQFTVPAHVPIDRVVFAPHPWPAQFSRDISITATPITPALSAYTAQAPEPVHTFGNLLRVHSSQGGHRIDEERLAFDAPWIDVSTPTQWTVEIQNGDDYPLHFKSVRIEMLERDFCFDAQPNASYKLYYGDSALAAPHYDYARLFTPQPNAVKVTAGPEQHNPIYKPRPDTRPYSEQHPALMWGTLTGVIVILGAIALRSSKPPA